MAQEEGLVTGVSDDGLAQVMTDRTEMCGDCGESHCCHPSVSGPKMVITALNSAGASVGDLVLVSLDSAAALKSSAIFCLIPLATLLSGAIAGARLFPRFSMSENDGAIAFGFAGLFLGFFAIVLISRWLSRNKKLNPVITRIMREGLLSPGSAIDPVCKMVVDLHKAPASTIHQDMTYYFCHPGCKESFLKDPEKYMIRTDRNYGIATPEEFP